MPENDPIAEQLKRNLKPRLDANRMTVLLVASVITNLALGIAISMMAPLKERVPYFVVADAKTGEVQVSSSAAQKFVANEQSRKYFAARFIRELLTIDTYRSRNDFWPDAKAVVMGKAIGQFDAFMSTENPVKKLVDNPSLARNVEITRITILPSAENVITADVTMTSLSGNGAAPQVVRRAVTLNYILKPPESDSEMLRNPIGFYVTQFTIDDIMGKL